MRLVALSLLTLSLLSCRHRARSSPREWRWENPRPVGVSLLSSCTTSDGRAVAVGEVGTVIVRSQGRWSRLASGVRGNLVSVACCPDGRFIAVGEDGVALSWNGGALRRDELGAPLRAAHCASDNTVVVSSSEPRVHVQRAGGSFVTSTTAERFMAVTKTASQWIGAAYSGRIYKSNDPAREWTASESAPRPLLSLATHGSITLGVGSVGTAMISRDNGARWSRVSVGSNEDWIAAHHDGAFFRVAGTGGAVMRSRDGAQWEREPGTVPPRAFGFARDGARLLVVGDDGFVSERGDREWTREEFPRGSVFALAATESSRWAIGREGSVLRQRSAGGPWVASRVDVPQDLRSISIAPQQVLVVGDGGVIARSTDDGRTWTRVESHTEKPLYSVWSDDRYHAIIVGEAVVLRSTDGGASWATTPLPDRWVLRAIAFDGEWLWAAGDGERVMRTRDYGRNWEYVALPRLLRVQQIVARRGRSLLVFGKDNVVLERSGDRWIEHPAPAEVIWDAVSLDSGLVAVGISGSIFRATHALSWTPVAPLTNEALFTVSATRSGAIYTAGEFGTILSFR